MILGIDISTSITGYTIMDMSGNLVELDHIELKKIKDGLWAKVDKFKEFVNEINKKYEIEHVFIEEPLSKFSRGKSSSATISLLMRFNGICSYLIHQEMGIDPVYYAPSRARKLCGLKMKSKTACKKDKIPWKPQKEQAFEQMNKQEPFCNGYDWPLKRTGRLKDYCYDRMDSFVIAKAGFVEMMDN